MAKDSNTSTDFRTDINGLRAWAVVAVILYHFGVPGFDGGFVGVDIFFVISGLLMTGIVVTGLERGKFSVWAFYMARARRIVPALVVLCAVLLALGWWLLTPTDYKLLGAHTVAALAFVSNMKFWLEAGYFDASSHEKWLLHTWSLAVEWQFYLLLPLVLLLVWKWRPGRGPVTLVVLVGLLVSYGLSVALTPTKPTGTFFLLPTRAWEMLAGGLVYLLAYRVRLSTAQRRALEAAGLVLAIASIIGFDATTAWPGWRAMLPVLAAVMVLLAARTDSVWTGHPIAQWLGTRSYSLYLWHWPMVVALVYLDAQEAPWMVAAALTITLLLGHLSFQWVESTARSRFSKFSVKRGAIALVSVTAFVATAGYAIQWKQGVLGRLSKDIEIVSQESLDKNPRREACHISSGVVSPSCLYGGKELQAIVLGDSHADALVSAVASAVQKPGGGVMEWAYSSCPTLFGVQPVAGLKGSNYHCDKFLDWASNQLTKISKEIPLIIINRTSVAAFGPNEKGESTGINIPLVYFTKIYKTPEPEFLKEFSEKLISTTCRLAKDRTVYLVRPIPEMGINVPNTARAMVWGVHKNVSISLAEYHQRHAVIWAAQDAAHDQCGVRILDPLPYLCWDGVCHGSKDGRPMYYDDDHLSEFGNRLLTPMFSQVFESTAK
nr:acyltransferase family protein [uncultured Albidiferax sp.]